MGKKTLFIAMGVALLLASCGIKTSLVYTWKSVSGTIDDAVQLANGDVLVTTKEDDFSPSDKAYILDKHGKTKLKLENCEHPRIINDMLCVWFNDEDKTRFYDLQSHKLVCTVNGFVVDTKTEDKNFISVYETKDNTFLIKTDPAGVVKWADSLDSMSVNNIMMSANNVVVCCDKGENSVKLSSSTFDYGMFIRYQSIQYISFFDSQSYNEIDNVVFRIDYSTGKRMSKNVNKLTNDSELNYSNDGQLMLVQEKDKLYLQDLIGNRIKWSIHESFDNIYVNDAFEFGLVSGKGSDSKLMNLKTGKYIPDMYPQYYPLTFHASSKDVALVEYAAKDDNKNSHYLFSALDPETGKVLWDKKMTSLQVDDLRDYETHFVTLKNPQTGIIHTHECIFLSEKMDTYDRIELVDVENGQTLWQMNKDHNTLLYECQIIGNDILLVYKSRMEKVDIATGIIKRRFWSDEGFVGFDTPDYLGSDRYIKDGLMVVRYKDHCALFDLNSFEAVMKTDSKISFKKTSKDTILLWNEKNLCRYSIVEK